jgi:hypothetical protein
MSGPDVRFHHVRTTVSEKSFVHPKSKVPVRRKGPVFEHHICEYGDALGHAGKTFLGHGDETVAVAYG